MEVYLIGAIICISFSACVLMVYAAGKHREEQASHQMKLAEQIRLLETRIELGKKRVENAQRVVAADQIRVAELYGKAALYD